MFRKLFLQGSLGLLTSWASSLFTWIFWLFKPLVSAQTLSKMKVVGTGPQTIGKEMLPHVAESELPTQYGGKSTLGASTVDSKI
jgi:hypothetical protein